MIIVTVKVRKLSATGTEVGSKDNWPENEEIAGGGGIWLSKSVTIDDSEDALRVIGGQ